MDAGIADTARQPLALELQMHRREVLDVDRQQEHAGAALEDRALDAVATQHLALVELWRGWRPSTRAVMISGAKSVIRSISATQPRSSLSLLASSPMWT